MTAEIEALRASRGDRYSLDNNPDVDAHRAGYDDDPIRALRSTTNEGSK